ncbi:MAG: hypothetical protein HY678_07995, partial [Chloroflexi bacterium]|nr:hypothetical protein [Chloroflexota bacterium]
MAQASTRARKAAAPARNGTAHASFVDAINHPVALLDSELNIVACNARLHAIVPGLNPDKPIIGDFNPAGLEELLRSVLASGGSARECELEMQPPDPARPGAKTRRFKVSAARINLDEGHGVLVTVDDVTADHLRDTQLMESRRLVAVGEMAAGVAHELNNPLTAVMGFSQLLLRQDLDEVTRRDIEAIATEARRAGRIVDNLLSFARRREHAKRPFDAARSVQRVLDLRQYECKVNNIRVVTYFDS